MEKKPMETDVKNLADDKKIAEKILEMASTYHARYESDREDIENGLEIADYMYAAAQNRAMLSSEKSKGMDRDKDTRANVGSIVFHRQVNTMAAQLVGVLRSRPDLWRYEQQVTDGNPESYEDSLERAQQAMALARWTRKADGFDAKIPEFAVSVYKHSNIFAMVTQKRTYKRKLCTQPITHVVGQEHVTGLPITEIVGEEQYWDEVLVDNFPSITFPHPGNIYADRWIPSIQGQNCVITVCPRIRSEIYNDVMAGYLSKDAYDKLDESYFWDGVYGSKQQEKERKNREKISNRAVWDRYVPPMGFLDTRTDNRRRQVG